jgi:hypothetical protein
MIQVTEELQKKVGRVSWVVFIAENKRQRII